MQPYPSSSYACLKALSLNPWQFSVSILGQSMVLVHAHNTKSKVSSCHKGWSYQPSETPYTNQALRASAEKSSWGRASAVQVELCHVSVATCSLTWSHQLARHGQQFDVASPVYTRCPLMLQLGGPSWHQATMSPWSNVFLAQGNNSTGVQLFRYFRLSRLIW